LIDLGIECDVPDAEDQDVRFADHEDVAEFLSAIRS
jgi:hypothetical protein